MGGSKLGWWLWVGIRLEDSCGGFVIEFGA